MGWEYFAPDGVVEVIVDPVYAGDILGLSRVHPVWIVASPYNTSMIDDCWSEGERHTMYEVNRVPVSDASDRLSNLLEILGNLDDHHMGRLIARVRGLELEDRVVSVLKAEGFRILESMPEGFMAERVESIRNRLIGRG